MKNEKRAEAGRLGGIKRTEKTKNKGFASMSAERRREISLKAVEARRKKNETK